MKFGETLRQRSIPAWNAHNIDYDEIKYFIKDRTTPGKGKAISIAGRTDEKHIEFENALYHVLDDQHRRIQLFVTSKAGEIRRRLDHVIKQLKRLAAQNVSGPVSIGRLEKYSKLESDILKAGDEIRSLARFTSTQRTAFRKLLKKYKKWTGSADLESRFRFEVLDSPKSFTNFDFDSMLDDYSDALQEIRSLYEIQLKKSTPSASKPSFDVQAESTPTSQLLAAIAGRSKVALDVAVGTVQFGDGGSLAQFFVHPDNAIELQVLLLRYVECYTSRSRPNTPSSPLSRTDSHGSLPPADYHVLTGDDADRLAREESTVTVDEREHLSGKRPQKAKVVIRWNDQEDAIVTHRPVASKFYTASMKRKGIDGFFEPSTPSAVRKGSVSDASHVSIDSLREEVLKDRRVQPLFRISSSRTRFVGLNNGANGVLIATLDSKILMEKGSSTTNEVDKTEFPFAVLKIRQEGVLGAGLLSLLNKCHLVERVRGFSLQYHALWQLYKPERLAPPLWLPILAQDIRKLPPPAIRSNSGSAFASNSDTQTGTQRSGSTADGTTAVETTGLSSSPAPEQLETPPLRAFRKKRRRTIRGGSIEPQQKYWSEYDHPEDLEGNDDAYVIYIDPNAKSAFDRFFDKFGKLFSSSRPEEQPLLPPGTPEEGEDSSDDEAVVRRKPPYGSIQSSDMYPRTASTRGSRHHTAAGLPHTSIICFSASMVILFIAYLLATTSKHKYIATVDAGVLFAIACSLAFAVGGFIPMLARRQWTWLSFSSAVMILLIDTVCCGGLLAWMLG